MEGAKGLRKSTYKLLSINKLNRVTLKYQYTYSMEKEYYMHTHMHLFF